MHRNPLPALLACLSSLFAAVSPAAAAGCCSPVVVSETTWPCAYPRLPEPELGVDASGGVYVLAFDRQAGGGSFLVVSHDDGESWEPRRGLSPFEANPATLAVTPAGRVGVAWAEGGELLYTHSADRGLSFSPPVRVGPAGGTLPALPTLALDDAGTAVLAWFSVTPAPDETGAVRASASSDFGAAWAPVRELASQDAAFAQDERPRVLALGTDALVLWSSRWNADHAWFARSADAGLNWSPADRIDPTRPAFWGDADLQLCRTAGSRAVAFYRDWNALRRTVALRAVATADAGRTWPETATVADAGNPVDLACTGGGGAYPLVRETTGDVRALASNGHGRAGSWRDEGAPCCPNSALRLRERLVAGPDGVLDLVYTDTRDEAGCPLTKCRSLYLERSCNEGLEWLPDQRLDTDDFPAARHSNAPRIARSPSGRVHVVWLESDAAANRPDVLHHAALDPAPLEPPAPTLEVIDRTERCGPATYTLAVTGLPASGCDSPRFAWLRDGSRLEGETGPRLDVPPAADGLDRSYSAILTCGNCQGATPEELLEFPLLDPPPAVTAEALPPEDCLAPVHRLAAGSGALEGCEEPAFSWYRDGGLLADETEPELLVSAEEHPLGEHLFHFELDCAAPAPCATVSEAARLRIEPPEDVPRPAPVGPVLFVGEHSDPHGAFIEADFDWSGDQGAPRPPGQHHHLLRADTPTGLRLIEELEPAPATGVRESTPAADRLPHVWFYRVLAANHCEGESLD